MQGSSAALSGAVDKNGNKITFTSSSSSTKYFGGGGPTINYSGTYTDTLDQPALTVALATDPANTVANYPDVVPVSQTLTYSYQGGDGGTSEYQLNYSAYNLATDFGCSGIIEAAGLQVYNTSGTLVVGPVVLPASLSLPDGRQYSFTYEPTPGKSGYTTGRITSITFPSGGSVSYTYGAINCADGSVMALTRTVNDVNGNTSVWKYSRSQSGST